MKYNEMEEIQKGLEKFLEEELQREGKPASGPDAGDEAPGGEDAAEESDETWKEEEEDVTGTSGRRRNTVYGSNRGRTTGGRVLQDEAIEDWDSPRKKSAKGSGGTRRSQGGTAGAGRAKGASAGKNGKSAGSRKGRKKSGFVKFLIVLLVLVALLGAAHYYLVGVIYGKMHYVEDSPAADKESPLQEDGVVNILLIGNDSRENNGEGRSDAVILLSVSNNSKKIYMTSLLRDMYVEIPGHDGNRLNAAYSFGGAELLMETVEENLGVPVNHYVQVNFEAFANLVDAVGGVDLELSSEEVEYVNGYLWEYNILTERPEGTDYMDTSLSGMLHLNGPQALAYSRNRYLGTDFGRTERQRKVLSAVIKELPKALAANPKGLMDGLLPNLTTNLTQDECYRLSFMAGKFLTYDIESGSIPREGTYKNADIRGMAVLEVDFEANRDYLEELLYEKK